jgi:hypothetical protein
VHVCCHKYLFFLLLYRVPLKCVVLQLWCLDVVSIGLDPVGVGHLAVVVRGLVRHVAVGDAAGAGGRSPKGQDALDDPYNPFFVSTLPEGAILGPVDHWPASQDVAVADRAVHGLGLLGHAVAAGVVVAAQTSVVVST